MIPPQPPPFLLCIFVAQTGEEKTFTAHLRERPSVPGKTLSLIAFSNKKHPNSGSFYLHDGGVDCKTKRSTSTS